MWVRNPISSGIVKTVLHKTNQKLPHHSNYICRYNNICLYKISLIQDIGVSNLYRTNCLHCIRLDWTDKQALEASVLPTIPREGNRLDQALWESQHHQLMNGIVVSLFINWLLWIWSQSPSLCLSCWLGVMGLQDWILSPRRAGSCIEATGFHFRNNFPLKKIFFTISCPQLERLSHPIVRRPTYLLLGNCSPERLTISETLSICWWRRQVEKISFY